MHLPNSLDYIAHALGNPQPVRHVNTPDDQNAAVLANLPADLSGEIVWLELNVARCQRAGKSARQSATCGRHHVIECGGVPVHLGHVHAVVLGDGAVHTKENRLLLSREPGTPERSTEPLDGDVRGVHDSRHGELLVKNV